MDYGDFNYGMPDQTYAYWAFYTWGPTAYDRTDAGNQGSAVGGIAGAYIGNQLGGEAGGMIGAGLGGPIGNVVGGYTYDMFNQLPFEFRGDYGTPPPGMIDPYTGISP